MTAVPVLTIDGPSGAGKGTVSRAVAKKLGWNYLDSGSIYRSLAIAVIDGGIPADDEAAVAAAAARMNLQFDCGEALRVFLDGAEVTDRLGSEATANIASRVASLPEVRRVLLQKQRDFQRPPGLVADGRDMGTVVFPEAAYKVFLTAGAEERALRRYKQLKEKGINANLIQITQEIEERDRRDQERQTAPLAMSSDALYIDSSALSIEAVINEVLNLIH